MQQNLSKDGYDGNGNQLCSWHDQLGHWGMTAVTLIDIGKPFRKDRPPEPVITLRNFQSVTEANFLHLVIIGILFSFSYHA